MSDPGRARNIKPATSCTVGGDDSWRLRLFLVKHLRLLLTKSRSVMVGSSLQDRCTDFNVAQPWRIAPRLRLLGR